MSTETHAESLHVETYEQAIELFFQRGWTDGLPVVIPTRTLVDAMLAGCERDCHESLGTMPPKAGEVTIGKLAVNAVMGGCRPEHFPVVIAAIEAMLKPEHNLNGVSQTTHMCVSLTIVNGPIARELNFNSRDGVFGNGNRSNGAVGRAVRLAIWNLGGAVPGETDKATLSHPGEYTFCIAEEEEDNPWEPFHVERGCPAGSDAVTVFACEAPHSVHCSGVPDEMLFTLSEAVSAHNANNMLYGGQTLVVLNPLNAQEFARRGWSKNDVRQYLWENARRPLSEVLQSVVAHREPVRNAQIEAGRLSFRYNVRNSKTLVPPTQKPEDIHIVVAGGRSYFAAVLPGWGAFGGYAVTAPIRRPRPAGMS
jgi:hypothetical protein